MFRGTRLQMYNDFLKGQRKIKKNFRENRNKTDGEEENAYYIYVYSPCSHIVEYKDFMPPEGAASLPRLMLRR